MHCKRGEYAPGLNVCIFGLTFPSDMAKGLQPLWQSSGSATKYNACFVKKLKLNLY